MTKKRITCNPGGDVLTARALQKQKIEAALKSGEQKQCPKCGKPNHVTKKASVDLCDSCGMSL